MSYLGRSAKLSRKAQEKVSFIATAGQTVKTGLAYVATFVEVHINGILVTDGVDYTATDGNSITFTVGLNLNDEVTVVSLKTFALADHYNKSEADALLGAKATTANFTSTGIDDNATSTAVTLDSSGNVGIGTSSPWTNLSVGSTAATSAVIGARTTKTTFGITPSNTAAGGVEIGVGWVSGGQGPMKFSVGSERMRIDSSGNVLVGTTTANPTSGTGTGISLQPAGHVFVSKASDASLIANRTGTDGDIAIFKRDGAAVGSIGSRASGQGVTFNSQAADGVLKNAGSDSYGWNTNYFYPRSDNNKDLGFASLRWDDVYATNGTIQTSDRNEKQDIEELSEAEQRIAVACKGLMRKFRWKDAVADKGDAARIHFGIIAQDLQAAFEAEGLDSGKYAMFISSTWWETQTAVPAVEAVEEGVDEEGNVTTEAVEAKDAYTETDTFDTLAEAPTGATERTRMGVRYTELLAFIIAALQEE